MQQRLMGVSLLLYVYERADQVEFLPNDGLRWKLRVWASVANFSSLQEISIKKTHFNLMVALEEK